MGRRIAVIEGHPDAGTGHLCDALADAYVEGAAAAGHEVRRIRVAALEFDMVRSRAGWQDSSPPEDIRMAQEALLWAEHVVIIYPLWLGTLPALFKAFLEQVLRPGFAFEAGRRMKGRLEGRSGRVLVTMGMPALVYRWFFRAHSLKSLERNILRFVGIRPLRSRLFGMVEGGRGGRRERWLAQVRQLGVRGR